MGLIDPSRFFSSEASSKSGAAPRGRLVKADTCFSRLANAHQLDRAFTNGSPEELAARWQDLVSFHGVEDILRGVDLARVLRGGGSLFSSSQGSVETYELSRRVNTLACFVSHNWAVARGFKFAALALYFNFELAALCSIVVCTALGVLEASGYLWTFERPDSGEVEATFAEGVACRMTVIPVFIIVLLFVRDVLAAFGRRKPMVFLDKCCIHQEDSQLMALGIAKLGAFIRKSNDVVVLFTNIYLTRLWTVYEVASFLILHPEKSMRIVPVYQMAMYCVVLMLFASSALITAVLRFSVGFSYLRYLVDTSVAMLAMLALRRWFRHRADIRRSLDHFSIRDCVCAVDSDREIVFANVIFLMKCTQDFTRLSSNDEVLDAFDLLVRARLPRAFAAVLESPWTYQLRHYLFFGFVVNGTATLDFWSHVASGMPMRFRVASFGEDLFWTVVAWPLLMLITERVAAWRLSWTGCKEAALIVSLCICCLMVPGTATHRLIKVLVVAAAHDDVAMVLLFGLTLVGLLLLMAITFSSWRRLVEEWIFPKSMRALDSAKPMGRRLEPRISESPCRVASGGDAASCSPCRASDGSKASSAPEAPPAPPRLEVPELVEQEAGVAELHASLPCELGGASLAGSPRGAASVEHELV